MASGENLPVNMETLIPIMSLLNDDAIAALCDGLASGLQETPEWKTDNALFHMSLVYKEASKRLRKSGND
jgi:hypothetical protein